MRNGEESPITDKRLLTSFYGDDFTGTMSTAEIFTAEGIPTVVFTKPPSPSFLKTNFPQVQVVGIAGTARTLPTDRLSVELGPVFETMKEHRALTYLYKVCSTFDSSTTVGNIGRAIELGMEAFASSLVAVIPAAPDFGRYLVFGNLFAAVGEENVHRLDRHPSMSTHPVTPMKEADLLVHLSKQTNLASGLVDILDVEQGENRIKERIQELISQETPLIFFDCLQGKHLNRICRAILEKSAGSAFIVGSHEVAYGLSSVFQESGLAQEKSKTSERKTRTRGSILVISGSCATVTGKQILWAKENGFSEISIQPEKLLDPDTDDTEKKNIIDKALETLRGGKSAVAHTSIGPGDRRIERVRRKAVARSLSMEEAGEMIGNSLGEIARAVLGRSNIRRIIIVGGDTSGRVQKHLRVEALQVAASVGDPAPICHVYSRIPKINGVEIAFKGGQVGRDDYFQTVQATKTADFSEVALGRL